MNLADVLAASVAKHPDKTAVTLGDEEMTYAEFDMHSTRLAHGLLRAGVAKGDRVALHMANTIEMASSYFACFKIGAIAVPINLRLKAAEIQYILEHSEPAAYLGDPGHLNPSMLPGNIRRTIRLFESTPEAASPGFSAFSILLDATEDAPLPEVESTDPAAILYTSGTTGRPKGVTHSHDSIMQCALACSTLGFSKDDVSLNFAPLAHASGFMVMFIPVVMLGAEMALVRAFDPADVLATLERRRATATFGLPAMLQALCREQAANPVDISTLRMCGAGGDTVSVALQEEFNAMFGLHIQEGIGMTELVPSCCNKPDRIRPGSVGERADGIDVRIVDDSGTDVAPGETGEMIVRGAAIMLGYWNDPDATAETIRDGWLYTGDLAHEDEDGYIWFDGRKKEVIIRGGSNISPQEVEEVLLRHPAVFQVGVVGMPDAEYGESVIAFVRLRAGKDCDGAELVEFAKELLSNHKVPEVVRFIDELPLNATGKVSRRTLKESLLAEFEDSASPQLASA